MPALRHEYRHGRIVWAYLRTSRGKREEHPAVIITPDADIIQPEDFDPRSAGDNALVVAGISTKYRDSPHPYVKLPFHPSEKGHPITGLRKDCAVIVGWYQALFIADDITAVSGDVPPEQMRALNENVFANYAATVGDQYVTAVEMLAELRRTLIERDRA